MEQSLVNFMKMANLPVEACESVTKYIQSNPDWKEKDKSAYKVIDWLLHILNGIPKAVQIADENDISESILLDTLGDIGVWAKNCKKNTGEWGLSSGVCGWLDNHINGRLFKVGRLQFIPKTYDWNFMIFRNKNEKNIIALTKDEEEYRGDGQVNGTNGIYDSVKNFKGSSQICDNNGEPYVMGTLISPYGYAINRVVRLDMDLWQEILPQGSLVLELHIQQEEKFDLESCRISLERIKDFANSHYKMLAKTAGIDEESGNLDKTTNPFVAFVCTSWLLDAQIGKIMPSSSNLVQFLREFYLLPYKSSDDATMERVFDSSPSNFNLNKPKASQTKTSLQRAIIEFMRNGGRMRSNKGFILLEDLNEYGSERYRKMF